MNISPTQDPKEAATTCLGCLVVLMLIGAAVIAFTASGHTTLMWILLGASLVLSIIVRFLVRSQRPLQPESVGETSTVKLIPIDSRMRETYPLAKEGANTMFRFLKEMNRDEAVKNALTRVTLIDTDNPADYAEDRADNRIFRNLDNRLAVIAMTDIIGCYEKLCKTDKLEYNAVGLPLAILLTLVCLDENELWDDPNYITENAFDIAQGCYDVITKNCSATGGEAPGLMVGLLRSAGEEELANRFGVMLYRFAMIIAKADGSVTPEEKERLSQLLSFSSDANEADSAKEPEMKPKGDALKELSSLIGLASVKSEVENIYNLVKIQKVRESKGMKSTDISYHCVFTGNPGTGKTTVARLVAQIYKDLGILSKGHLVETDRSGLVAEYVGQTAVKTNKIVDSALDGVLFIDEAYSLVQGGNNDFGMEAIATLLKRMEDNRDRLVVILAGYSDEMKQFIDANPGLQSRFNRYIHFEDYNADDLVAIYGFNLKKYDYRLTDDGMARLRSVLTTAVANKDKNFGNARYVRNLFEKTLENQARRLAAVADLSEDTLAEIRATDIPATL